MPTTKASTPEELPPARSLAMPAVGGARTLAQLEALARKLAGEYVPPQELAPCDRHPLPPTKE